MSDLDAVMVTAEQAARRAYEADWPTGPAPLTMAIAAANETWKEYVRKEERVSRQLRVEANLLREAMESHQVLISIRFWAPLEGSGSGWTKEMPVLPRIGESVSNGRSTYQVRMVEHVVDPLADPSVRCIVYR